ncbi:MAG TPA: hypothetical protein DCQ06_08580, partial [Myxococcales bacterium]|nr:hypothetical protein [Myxococcales bacterium]HAN31636.1 hypothetical protein [Myxococcales bacterium]
MGPWSRLLGLACSPVVAALVWWFHPQNMSHPAGALLALLAGTLVLWLTEALPVAVTALASPALGVLLGIASVEQMFAPFAHPTVLLFFGVSVWFQAAKWRRLDRALASQILPEASTTIYGLLRAIAMATGALSALASSRSVAALMLPVVDKDSAHHGLRYHRLGLLSVSWCAAFGSVATAIGAPANLAALAALAQYDGREVPLLYWSLIAMPVAVSLLLLWLGWIRWLLGPLGAREVYGELRNQRRQRSPTTAALKVADTVPFAMGLDRGQFAIAVVGIFCAILWSLPGVASLIFGVESVQAQTLADRLPPAVIALLAVSALFVMPVGQKTGALTRDRPQTVLSWEHVRGIDWDLFFLLGCGLALGHQTVDTGLARWLGHLAIKGFALHSEVSLTLAMVGLALMLTQFASDTVCAAVLCPLAVVASQ